MTKSRKEAIKYLLESLDGLDLWGDDRKKNKKTLNKLSDIARANNCLICFSETYDTAVFKGIADTKLSRAGGKFYLTDSNHLYIDPCPKDEPNRKFTSQLMSIPARKDYILPWRISTKEFMFKEFDLKVNKKKFCRGTLIIL